MAATLVVGLQLTFAVAACSPLQRHRVLEVLIDGVPPYLSPEERARLAAEAPQQELAATPQGRRSRTGRRRPVTKLSRFTHGPFAAKECGRCHDLGAASGFRGPGGGGALGPASSADLAEAGRLRMPVVELCTYCHAEFGASGATDSGSWTHGPVATGWCITCHQPHTGFYPSLVSADPAAALCEQCHRAADLVAFTPEHIPAGPEEAYPSAPPDEKEDEATTARIVVVKNCTRCHDPHRGAKRNLLRKVSVPRGSAASGPPAAAAPGSP